MSQPPLLHYKISPKNLGGHLFTVRIEIPNREDKLIAKLPRWIPGSYKIRDYARNIQNIRVFAEGEAVAWQKVDSCCWHIAAVGKNIVIEYEVYAYDLSVRGAYLDDQRLFFNHCCVFLDIESHSKLARCIEIETVDDWAVYSELAFDGQYYYADSYDAQIDCPVESARTTLVSTIPVSDIPHHMIYSGLLSEDYDTARTIKLVADICQAQMQLFTGSPIDKEYLFMTYIEPQQYGGLEHKNSTALLASPEMMLKKGQPLSEKNIDFLGLCSHEYFHLWNIKRLRPADLMPYDLYREQNSEMLWMFEGFTSYYDELMLLRAGVVDGKQFLSRQAKNISNVLKVPGRLLQSVAESSFDAWTKLYQADENSANNMVSYYSKGAVFALYLDLWLRQYSNNKASLDEVMRDLWVNYGQKNIGIDENSVFKSCAALVSREYHESLVQVFIQGIHGRQDLDLKSLLITFGVEYKGAVEKIESKPQTSDSGFKVKALAGKWMISFLATQSIAAVQGVSVNDEIIAINQQAVSSLNIQQRLNLGTVGEELVLTLNRRGRVINKTITLTDPEKTAISLLQVDRNPFSDDWLATWVS